MFVTARIIRQTDGRHKLIYTAEDNITLGRIEIVTKGENGRSLQLRVKEVIGTDVGTENGHIVIRNVPAGIKQTVVFSLTDSQNYAMGVKAYGN